MPRPSETRHRIPGRHSFNIPSAWSADIGSGTVASAPAAVASRTGTILVFARNGSNQVLHAFRSGETWSGSRRLALEAEAVAARQALDRLVHERERAEGVVGDQTIRASESSERLPLYRAVAERLGILK